MSDRLLKNLCSAAGQTVVQTAVLVLLYRYLLHTIGIEKLGVWSVVLATTSASRVSELGLSGSVTKFVAKYRAQKLDRVAEEVLQTAAISLSLALGAVLFISYPALAWALKHILPPASLADAELILPFAMVSLWLTSMAGVWMGGLDGCLRSDLRAAVTIIGSFSFLLLSLVTVKRYGLTGLALAQVAQGAILVCLGWIALRRAMHSLPLLPTCWKGRLFKEMVGYGANLQVNSVVTLLFEPTTKVLLVRFGDLATVGYFEMAQRVVAKVRALAVESNQVIVPVFAELHEKDYGKTRALYLRNLEYMAFVVTPVFAALAALAPAISEAWIGRYEVSFVAIVILISLAWFVNTLTAPAYFAYLGGGKLGWITISHLVMGAVNAIGGIALGKLFGWQGVTAAFCIALALGSVVTTWAYHRENRIVEASIFAAHNLAFGITCFGGAALLLVTYSAALAIDASKWLRIGSSAAAALILISAAIWIHPLRQRIVPEVMARLRRKLATK